MSLLSRLMNVVQSLSEPDGERALAALADMRKKASILVALRDSPAQGAAGRWLVPWTIERGSTIAPGGLSQASSSSPDETSSSTLPSLYPATDSSETPDSSSFPPSSQSPDGDDDDPASSVEPAVARLETSIGGDTSPSTSSAERVTPAPPPQQQTWTTAEAISSSTSATPAPTLPPAVFPDVPYPNLSRGTAAGGQPQRGPRNMINFMVAEPTRRIAIHLSGGSATHIGLPHALPPGFPHAGNANLTAFMGPRGSMGTLAGSLHGGVNVLLGGAMLSGLILIVFFICYCCQRSARKNDSQFRTQYWLPDPDGPLEVFTLDAQAQRLFLPAESMEALMQQAQRVSPSPPPAYHTVCQAVCLKPPPAEAAEAAEPAELCGGAGHSSTLSDADVKPSAMTPVPCEEMAADGLPSYEAALKLEQLEQLEAQGHM